VAGSSSRKGLIDQLRLTFSAYERDDLAARLDACHCPLRALRRWLRKQPDVLDDKQVSAVYQAARDPATWQTKRAAHPRWP